LKDINEIILYVKELLKDVLGRKGKKVKITNVIKNETKIYRSKREAARDLKADSSSIYNRNKLWIGIYKIEILD
jgi:NUMOD1 domain